MTTIKSHIKVLQTFVLMLLCGACLLPKPPSSDILKTQSKTTALESYRVIPQDVARLRGERRPWRSAPKAPERNLLFVAVDETVQVQFQERLRELYRTEQEVRLEDVSWWRFVPKMRGLYDQVLRIPHDQLNAQSLEEAIVTLEQMRKPYDIMLLTHGIPNHVTASQIGRAHV